MKVVLDTNVLVSATLVQGGKEDRVLRAWRRGAFDLVLSPEILREIGRVLFYPKFQSARWVTEAELVALLETLAKESFLVAGQVTVEVCRDPEDDKFLAAAVESGARYLVSGDRDLLDLKSFRGVEIVTPGVFLKVLGESRKRET